MKDIKSVEGTSSMRWELATRLHDSESYAKICAQLIFIGIMEGVEQLEIKKISKENEEKIWLKISVHQIKKIKEEMISQISLNLLNSFKDEEVEKMLHQHQQFGSINHNLGNRFEKIYKEKREQIEDKVIEYAQGLTGEFINDVMKELNNSLE